MKKKQIIAAFLAAATAVTMAVPSFALTSDEKDAIDAAAGDKATEVGGQVVNNSGEVGGVTVETDVQKPTLAVVLPTTVKVFVNPYRAEVATHYTDPSDATSADKWSIDTVVSPEMTVVNYSDCAVKIGVKGSFVTYSYKNAVGDLKAIASNTNTDATGIAITGWDTLNGTVDNTQLFADTNSLDTAKTFYAKVTVNGADEYRLVTAKVTKANATKDTPAAVVITGYTASKTIKVATAALKDEDAEKTNSIFMYVEGSLESGVYAPYAKTVAGVKDKSGVMSMTGQFALSAKEASQAVLYLEGGDVKNATGKEGYIRVSGNAATAPTTSWSEAQATEGFETPFVFTVDPVANVAEKAPELTTLTGANEALTAGKYAYSVDITEGSTSAQLTIAFDKASGATIAAGTSDGTVVSKVATTDTRVTITVPASATAGSKGTCTFILTSKYGKTTTYTVAVNVVAP